MDKHLKHVGALMCALYALEKVEIVDLKATITSVICDIIKMSNSTVSTLIRNNLWEPLLNSNQIKRTILFPMMNHLKCLNIFVYFCYHINHGSQRSIIPYTMD